MQTYDAEKLKAKWRISTDRFPRRTADDMRRWRRRSWDMGATRILRSCSALGDPDTIASWARDVEALPEDAAAGQDKTEREGNEAGAMGRSG